MYQPYRILFALLTAAILASPPALPADDEPGDTEQLKAAAIEALISAPPERALPIVTRVLRGNDSDEIKEKALFVLSQIETSEAQNLLLEVARDGSPELREEAVRMIGISGSREGIAALAQLYRDGDEDLREAVLEAYLIADDADAVLAIAEAATTADEFEAAVETLGAMNASEQLRALRSSKGTSEALIEAYAIAGDVETLRELALDTSDPRQQAEALHGLAVAGGSGVNELLVQVYRGTQDEDLKEAALEAMLIADYDEGVLALFRESQDPKEKRQLLETLVMMDSDAVWDLIDATLDDSATGGTAADDDDA
jgi:HEAT repeat protein